MDRERTTLFELILSSLHTTMLQAFRVFTDYVTYPALSYLKSGPTRRLLKVDDEILLTSASDLAAKIRSGELASYRVVQAFKKRLDEIDPVLNAVTDERYQEALKEAKAVDERLERCRSDANEIEKIRTLEPFLGVPVTTKNACAVKDLGNESGLYLKKGTKAPKDSAPIAQMRASGAIPLAVTNTPELCLWLESNNPLFGRTLNPYDTNRTCGGSSGGEGAVLSGCGSPLGVGSDFAGSVRIPACYNGIFGLKPTRETTDLTGHFPPAKDILKALVTSGPMCKYAKDLRPFLSVLVGPSNSQKMGLDSAPKLDNLKVIYLEDFNSPIITPVLDEIRQRTEAAALHLSSLTESVPQIAQLPKLAHAFDIYMSYIAKADTPPTTETLALDKGRVSLLAEAGKLMVGRCKHTIPILISCFLEYFSKKSRDSPSTTKYFEMRLALEAEIEKLLGDEGLLVCPTLPILAPHHDLTILRTPILAYTGIWNVLGFPAVSVPMGLSKEGVPIGVTVVAGKFKDNLCCEVAIELEKKFGGWVPPFETEIDYVKTREGCD